MASLGLVSRPFAIAFAAFAAALCLLAALAPVAPAEDLTQALEAKESQLEETHERKGVLTTTISRYQARIKRLSGAVTAIRDREAVTQARLDAEGQRLAAAGKALERAHVHLTRRRYHLRVALGGLRERLVAMYGTGSP